MTKFQKQMLTIAAAGALTAVTALPAMAFENQFNGTMTVKTYLGNFDNGTSAATAWTQEKMKTNNYTDQRLRINYTAKASDDLKLITQVEANTRWGNSAVSSLSNTSGGGGGIDTDGINLAVRHAYLDFNIGQSVNIKAGQQPFKDTLGGLYVDADLPMARLTYKQGSYTLGLGYSRFNDENSNQVTGTYMGDVAADLYAVENTFALSKDTKVGFSYYLNADNSTTAISKKVNTFGLFGATKLGSVDLSGFAAYQAGYLHAATAAGDTHYHGWAANLLAKMKTGNGLARAGFLFVSGDNNDETGSNRGWQTLSSDKSTANQATAGQNSYNESGMMLLVRNTSMGGTGTDDYFRKPITNIALLHLGYDANLSEKLYANGNIGMAWLPASDYLYGATGNAVKNGSDILGAELNAEVGYKLYKNLTLKAQAAYVMLGGAFDNTATNGDDPANAWTLRAGAFYSF